MLKILVVDDEKPIRTGLRAIINNMEGFEVVGQAGDGLMALEEIKEHAPHVVVTDIRMPRMDGKELVKYLNMNYPSVRKIVLSGFEDFDYIRDTMKNGAVDYLLKPVDEKELLSLLEKIESDIRAEEACRLNNLKMRIRLNESFPYLRDQFVIKLLKGGNISREEFERKLDYFNMKLDSSCFCVIIISINNYRFICRNEGVEEARLTAFMIRNIAEETVARHVRFFSCTDGAELVISAALPDMDEAGKEKVTGDILNDIYSNLLKYVRVDFTISVGEPVEHELLLKHSYSRALSALVYRFYRKSPAVIRYAEIKNNPFGRIDSDLFRNMADKYESLFDNSLKTGNMEKLKELLDELCLKFRQFNIHCVEAVKLFFEIHSKLESRFPGFRKAVDEIWGPEYSYIKELELFDSIDDIKTYTNTAYARIIERIISGSHRKSRKLAEIAKEYVERHYNESITLKMAANLAYVNPKYFCEAFKSQTGENFVDYVTRVRIEKAKVLLRDISMKTYEVGLLVGYESSEYFSKVFKKMVGVSPTEYRNLNM